MDLSSWSMLKYVTSYGFSRTKKRLWWVSRKLNVPHVSEFYKETEAVSLSLTYLYIYIPMFILLIFIFNEGIYFKELTHDNGGWQVKSAGWVGRLRNQEGADDATQVQRPSAEFHFAQESPSDEQRKLTQITEGNLLYSKSINLNVNLIPKHPPGWHKSNHIRHLPIIRFSD